MNNFRKFLDVIQLVIILGLLGVIFFMKGCQSPPKVPTPPPPPKEIKYDTVIKNHTVYVPKLVTKFISKTDTMYLFIEDSTRSAICEQYRQDAIEFYTTKVFVDEQTSDSLDLTIIDTVYKNSIINRALKYNLKVPSPPAPEVIYKDKIIPDIGFYGGLGIVGTPKIIDYLGIELLYKTPKPFIYSVGVGVNSNFSPTLAGRVYWKLSK